MNPMLAFYNVDVKMKDSEIRDMVKTGFEMCHKTGKGGLLSVDGYNEDPRDLWQIPEVINFAKKLCAMGVCSILELSTYLDPTWESTSNAGRPFGAFELWLLAKEELGQTIQPPRVQELFARFCDQDLPKSNDYVIGMIQGRVDDGNHKV